MTYEVKIESLNLSLFLTLYASCMHLFCLHTTLKQAFTTKSTFAIKGYRSQRCCQVLSRLTVVVA